jgi:hypothetical protein
MIIWEIMFLKSLKMITTFMGIYFKSKWRFQKLKEERKKTTRQKYKRSNIWENIVKFLWWRFLKEWRLVINNWIQYVKIISKSLTLIITKIWDHCDFIKYIKEQKIEYNTYSLTLYHHYNFQIFSKILEKHVNWK